MTGDNTHLSVITRDVGKVRGSSPSADLYYVVILFDISEPKKYRALIKILKSYSSRIQKSVFEAQLKSMQIERLLDSIEKLMSSGRFFNEDDNVRIYRIAGNCRMTVFGSCREEMVEEDLFF